MLNFSGEKPVESSADSDQSLRCSTSSVDFTNNTIRDHDYHESINKIDRYYSRSDK